MVKYSKKMAEKILLKLIKSKKSYEEMELEIIKLTRKQDKKKLTNDNFIKNKDKIKESRIEVDWMYNISGVYFLFKDDNLIYIGESSCIIRRISEHITNGVMTFNYFKIFQIEPNSDARKEIEKRMIKKHNPICNLQHNHYLQLKKM
mgnify:CR=1 FL=1